MSGLVKWGTCGWSDPTLKGKLYPSNITKLEDRLPIYANTFPSVEVDSSCYAIPRARVTENWCSKVPAGFIFHFKAFGLFCAQSIGVGALPHEVREGLEGLESVTLKQMGEEKVAKTWQIFHAGIEPMIRTGKMGMVVFQYHLSFAPSQANREYVLWCRKQLDPRVVMAIEFRNRGWFADELAAGELFSWASENGLVVVAADELRHETYQPDKAQRGLPEGEAREVLPIATLVTNPAAGLYVRLHRRHGTAERILPADEVEAWARRLSSLCPLVGGPVWFMLGTEWEDAPLINAKSINEALAGLAPQFVYDHKASVKSAAAANKGSLLGMFAAAQKRVPAAPAPSAETPVLAVDNGEEERAPKRARGGEGEDMSAEAGPSGAAAAALPGSPFAAPPSRSPAPAPAARTPVQQGQTQSSGKGRGPASGARGGSAKGGKASQATGGPSIASFFRPAPKPS